MPTDRSQGTVTVLYFARLSEQLGLRQETVSVPEEIASLAALRGWLAARGERWSPLADANLRMALNQQIIKQDAPLKAGDEVAFFPPVTGG